MPELYPQSFSEDGPGNQEPTYSEALYRESAYQQSAYRERVPQEPIYASPPQIQPVPFGGVLVPKQPNQLGTKFLKIGSLLLLGGILVGGGAFVALAGLFGVAPQAPETSAPVVFGVIGVLVALLDILFSVALMIVGFIWRKVG